MDQRFLSQNNSQNVGNTLIKSSQVQMEGLNTQEINNTVLNTQSPEMNIFQKDHKKKLNVKVLSKNKQSLNINTNCLQQQSQNLIDKHQNEQFTLNRFIKRPFKHLTKKTLETCIKIGNKTLDKAIGGYFPEFLQHMFEKEVNYFDSMKKITTQEVLKIKRRQWTMVEYCHTQNNQSHDSYLINKHAQNQDQQPYFYADQIDFSNKVSYKTPNSVNYSKYLPTQSNRSQQQIKFQRQTQKMQTNQHSNDSEEQKSIKASSLCEMPHANSSYFEACQSGYQIYQIQTKQNTVSKRESELFRRKSSRRNSVIQIDPSLETDLNNEESQDIFHFQPNISIQRFNQCLLILNSKIQVILGVKSQLNHQILQRQRLMSRQFYSSYEVWTDRKYKNRVKTDGVFLQSTLALIQLCEDFNLSSQTIFAAGNLFYTFLIRHPQLLLDQFEFTDYFKNDQQQQSFFCEMLQYIIISCVSISSRCHQTYFPGLGSLIELFNESLTYEILVKIQTQMQIQLTLIDFNFLSFDYQIKWLNFMGLILEWIDDKDLEEQQLFDCSRSAQKITTKIQKGPKLHKSNVRKNSGLSQKKSKSSFEGYNIKICEFILETGLINFYLYQYPVSKKIGAVMTIYLKYWLKKNMNSQIIKFIWEATKLDIKVYEKLESMYVCTLKYCEQKKVESIKSKYFMKGINPKSYLPV